MFSTGLALYLIYSNGNYKLFTFLESSFQKENDVATMMFIY